MAVRKEYNQSWNPFWLNMPESEMPIASEDTVGGVKVGEGLDIEEDGTLNTDDMPIASAETLGGVKVGDGLTIDANGVLSEEDMVVRRYQYMRTGMNTGTAYSPTSGSLQLTVNQYYDADHPLFFQFEFTGTPVTSDSDRDLAALNGSFFLTVKDLQSTKTVSDTFRTIKKKVFMGVYSNKEIWATVNLDIKYDPYVSEDGIWPSYTIGSTSMNIAAADGSDLPEAYVSVYLWVRGSKTKVDWQ